jgi:proline-specific peptidase
VTLTSPVSEGFIPFQGYRTWYRVVGDQASPDKLPLLLVHGGPGIPSACLEPFEAFAATGRPVVFYDQLGCGNSDVPDDPALWSFDLFLDEIAAVRSGLSLERCHLLGFSWGGELVMEYVLGGANGIASLILHSTYASTPAILASGRVVYDELPTEVREVMLRHEAAGTIDHPEYREARGRVFDVRYVCRIDPWPEFLQRAIATANFAVGEALESRYGQYAPGGQDTWDITARLREIDVPTLVLSGRHDGLVRGQDEVLAGGIPGSEWVRFEESSHYAHAEETQRFFAALDDFLTRVEQG